MTRIRAVIVAALLVLSFIVATAPAEAKMARISQEAQIKTWVKALPPTSKLSFTQYVTGWDTNRSVAHLNAIDPVFKYTLGAWVAKVNAALFAQWVDAIANPHGQCGGDLPPCYVMMRESHGNPLALNPSGDASGKWQFLDSTWNWYAGYRKAMFAPERIQDDKARLTWANGAGCSHWSAC